MDVPTGAGLGLIFTAVIGCNRSYLRKSPTSLGSLPAENPEIWKFVIPFVSYQVDVLEFLSMLLKYIYIARQKIKGENHRSSSFALVYIYSKCFY